MLYGGRWNSPGQEMLYSSSSLALACLEILVHIRQVDLLPIDYGFAQIDIPQQLIRPWTFEKSDSMRFMGMENCSREFGDKWLSTADKSVCPVQAVPSAVIPQ